MFKVNSPHQSSGTLWQSGLDGRSGSTPVNGGGKFVYTGLYFGFNRWLMWDCGLDWSHRLSPSPASFGLVLPDDVIQTHVHLVHCGLWVNRL